MNRFRGPVRRKRDGFVVDLGANESAIVTRLVGELRAIVTDPDPGPEASALLVRLFPVAYPGDTEAEAEYQRLMRDELVQSKLAAFDIVTDALERDEPIDEGGLVAVMQSVNSIRLVLGAMLDVHAGDDGSEVDVDHADSAEYALYTYLSWLLESCVRTLTGD